MDNLPDIQRRIIAAVDLIDRAGARDLTIGWTCPHVPADGLWQVGCTAGGGR